MAVARELAGWCWSLAVMDCLKAADRRHRGERVAQPSARSMRDQTMEQPFKATLDPREAPLPTHKTVMRIAKPAYIRLTARR